MSNQNNIDDLPPQLNDFASQLLIKWWQSNPPTGNGEKNYTALSSIKQYILSTTGAEDIDTELLLRDITALGYQTEIMGGVLHLVHY